MVVASGDVIGGKYRLDAVLGAGGMGRVFRGLHLGLNRVVAIKVMHEDMLGTDVARRFAREAQAAASLKSEHAVRIIDTDHLPSGVPYIVMDYLEGRDLINEIVDRGPLPWDRAVGYALDAAEAIAEA